MSQRETFTIGDTDVAVEESADALTYTFTPNGSAYRPSFPIILLVIFVVFPLGLLGLVVYAYLNVTNRPEWGQLLTALFAIQLLLWLVVGAGECFLMIRWSIRGIVTTLRFTPAHVQHADDRVCELEEIRGLRLFTYPANEEPTKTEACLSLVIGEDGGTHGLFGGFEQPQLRILAEDIHSRLSTFRFNQGIMSALEAISVVETTEEESGKLMHTRPPRSGFRLFANTGLLLLQNRWAGTAWCLAMFAGLFATGRLVADAGLPNLFLLGHALVAFMHFAFLTALWTPQKPDTTTEKKD